MLFSRQIANLKFQFLFIYARRVERFELSEKIIIAFLGKNDYIYLNK